jgi:hypothetical protein
MRLKCISCEVLARITYHCASLSPHIVDIEFLERGLHEKPANLNSILQRKIDCMNSEDYDAIVLGYGLCGKSTAGITAGKIPIVIPRAHDCITLFLGDRKKYQSQFEQYPGTYWFVQDYIERTNEHDSLKGIGSFTDLDTDKTYSDYVKKYGKENADFLMETLGTWQKHYQRAVFIDHGLSDGSQVEALARREAETHQWLFEKFIADFKLIRKLLNGEWDSDFHVIPPGKTLKMSFTDQIFAI